MTEPGHATQDLLESVKPSPAETTHEPSSDPTSSSSDRWMRRLAAEDAPKAADSVPGTTALFALGLMWLAVTLWSAHAALSAAGDGVNIANVILVLPALNASSLLAGAAAGLFLVTRFSSAAGRWRRLVVGLGAGTVCGLLTAAAVLLAHGWTGQVAVLAATTGVAALLGGALAATPAVSLASGLAGTFGAFAVGVLLSFFQSPLKSLLGAGDSFASQEAAAQRFFYASAALSGLVAGVLAYLLLRRRFAVQRWPAYLVAGATAGLVLFAAEILAVLATSVLLTWVGADAADALSGFDWWAIAYVSNAGFIHAMVVGFAGALTAMIAFGRTLNRREDPQDSQDSAANDATDSLGESSLAGSSLAEDSLARDAKKAGPASDEPDRGGR